MCGSKICRDLNSIEMDRQHTAGIAHRMLGIGAQVHEHLLELGWIRQDRAEAAVQDSSAEPAGSTNGKQR